MVPVEVAVLLLVVFFFLSVKSEPADIDMVDTEEIKKEETIKKPVKRVPVKKETNQDRFLNLLSTQSEVCWQ